jgi:hypothetical protein
MLSGDRFTVHRRHAFIWPSRVVVDQEDTGMLFNAFVALVIIVVIIGVLVFLLSRVDPESDPDEKKSAHRLKHGETYRAYVVLPPGSYYANGWPERTTSCQVVFIKSPKNLPEGDERLESLGERLLTFQAAEGAPKDERIIANVFKSEIGYYRPLRLPARISDDVEAYTVSVKMKKATWPADWQPEPFFDIKVVFDGPQAGALRANHIIPEKYRNAE